MPLVAKSKLKKWGNSVGVVIPNEVVKAGRLQVGEQVEIQVRKATDVTKLRGKFPIDDIQAAKEEMRKAWSG